MFLRLISSLYGTIQRTRRNLYKTGRLKTGKLPVPVLSVGNISMGGTGKTPAVAAITQILKELGRKPGILTRGYGRKRKHDVILTGKENKIDWRETGDEPAMLYKKLKTPMGIGSNRYQTGRKLLSSADIDCLVLDDAYQHLGLHRDLNIAMVPADLPPWNDKLFPRGFLRESVNSLSAADIFLVNGQDPDKRKTAVQYLKTRYPDKKSFEVWTTATTFRTIRDGNEIQAQDLEGKKVYAFAAIAGPERFEKTLTESGMVITGKKWFRDHHAFSQQNMDILIREMEKSGAEFAVTTEKDAVRLNSLSLYNKNFVETGVKLSILDKKGFTECLKQII